MHSMWEVIGKLNAPTQPWESIECEESTPNMVCVQEFGRRIPFAFLEDVRERYLAKFSDSAQTTPAYAHNAEFSKVPAHELICPCQRLCCAHQHACVMSVALHTISACPLQGL